MVCKKSLGTVIEPAGGSQLEFIKRDINEISEEKLRHNERLMNEWIRCQNHFPKNVDQGLIRAFLRGSKHSLEKAKKKLEHHLAARHLYPEIYADRSPFARDVVQAMDVVNIATMPKLTVDGCRLHIFALEKFDPAEFYIEHIVKLFFMTYELIISSDNPAAGDIAVFDAAHFGTGHVAKYFGPFFRTLATLLKEAYAMRLKQIHIINAPSMVGRMMSIVKPLLHPKVSKAVYIYQNSDTILSTFGPEHLPSNYGGNLKSLRYLAQDWYDVLKDTTDWFKGQEDVKITGVPKRIESNLYYKDELGIEGSFRRLEID